MCSVRCGEALIENRCGQGVGEVWGVGRNAACVQGGAHGYAWVHPMGASSSWGVHRLVGSSIYGMEIEDQ